MTTQHSDEPLGAVVHRLSEQLPELVRSELRLAQARPPAPEWPASLRSSPSSSSS